jgi:TonB family protein
MTRLLVLVLALAAMPPQMPKKDEVQPQQCQLIPDNPPGWHAFAYVPSKIRDKRFKNRRPRISFTVGEDGRVSKVKVIKGTGSPSVDAAVVKSIYSWKYKPQTGCVIETAVTVTIDFG